MMKVTQLPCYIDLIEGSAHGIRYGAVQGVSPCARQAEVSEGYPFYIFAR